VCGARGNRRPPGQLAGFPSRLGGRNLCRHGCSGREAFFKTRAAAASETKFPVSHKPHGRTPSAGCRATAPAGPAWCELTVTAVRASIQQLRQLAARAQMHALLLTPCALCQPLIAWRTGTRPSSSGVCLSPGDCAARALQKPSNSPGSRKITHGVEGECCWNELSCSKLATAPDDRENRQKRHCAAVANLPLDRFARASQQTLR